MASKGPEAFRTISEVADELELPQHVLRFWETRFTQIRPMKRGGGRRYYRPDDVELLRGIRALLYSEGYTIRGVQRILKEQGPRIVVAAGRPKPAAASDAPRRRPAAPPPKPRPVAMAPDLHATRDEDDEMPFAELDDMEDTPPEAEDILATGEETEPRALAASAPEEDDGEIEDEDSDEDDADEDDSSDDDDSDEDSEDDDEDAEDQDSEDDDTEDDDDLDEDDEDDDAEDDSEDDEEDEEDDEETDDADDDDDDEDGDDDDADDDDEADDDDDDDSDEDEDEEIEAEPPPPPPPVPARRAPRPQPRVPSQTTGTIPLSRDDIRRLTATLSDLLELKRRLDQARD